MKRVVPIGNAVLLHICCGVCESWPVQKLRDDGYTVYGYFFNPNIYPYEEYQKRLESAKRISDYLEIELIEEFYNHELWLKVISGFEKDKEGGNRCKECYKFRIQTTYNFAKMNNFNKISTTLSVSPHKNSQIINSVGSQVAENNFLPEDFKKNGGFNKSKKIAKINSLYFQNYCGCEFSLK